jgi:hypothetical protein
MKFNKILRQKSPKILVVTTFTVALYDVSRLVLSPIVTRPAAQQQHGVSWVGWWGGPTHYLVTPTRVEVELRLSWAVTIEQPREATPLKQGVAQMGFWSS